MKSRRNNCAQFCDTDYWPLLADIRTGDMYKLGTRTRTSQQTALRGHHLGFCSQSHSWFYISFQEPGGVSSPRRDRLEDFPVFPLQGPAAGCAGLEVGFPLGAFGRQWKEGPPVPHQPHQVRPHHGAYFSFASSGGTWQRDCLSANPGSTSFSANHLMCASVFSLVNWG